MNILYIDPDPKEARRAQELLRRRNHHVVVQPFTSAATVAKAVRETDADSVVIAWSLMERGIGAFATAIRGARPGAQVVLVVVLDRVGIGIIEAIAAAGADDVIHAGAPADELVARAEGIFRRVKGASATGGRHQDLPATGDVQSLAAWQDLHSIVVGELSGVLGCSLSVVDVSRVEPVWMAAEIPLSLVSESVEVRVMVGIGETSAGGLAQVLFDGPVAPDGLSDALRELANAAAGAFKRMAMAEGTVFTLGLPISRPAFLGSDKVGRFWGASTDSGVTLLFGALCLSSAPVRVAARDLHEGMVLVHDVKNAVGVSLLTAGTSLTERTIERLISVVGPQTVIEVGNPTGLFRAGTPRAAVG